MRGIASQLMNLVADRVVKPFRHVAPDEFNRGHAADLVRIRLPERAVQWAAGLLAPGFDGLGNLDLLELPCRQSAVVDDHRFARVRIHHAAHVWARVWYSVGMPPEVTELGSLASDDKQRWPPAERQPAFSGTRRIFAQPQLAQCCLQPFPHDAPLPQPHFVHSVRFVLVTAISQIVDQEHAYSGQCQKRLPGPLFDQVWGNHC